MTDDQGFVREPCPVCGYLATLVNKWDDQRWRYGAHRDPKTEKVCPHSDQVVETLPEFKP